MLCEHGLVEIGVFVGGSGGYAVGATQSRCHRQAPWMAPRMGRSKVEIEKMKLLLKEPLSSPGGEGAGQKRKWNSFYAWGPGPSGEVVRLRGMGKDHLFR